MKETAYRVAKLDGHELYRVEVRRKHWLWGWRWEQTRHTDVYESRQYACDLVDRWNAVTRESTAKARAIWHPIYPSDELTGRH